MTDDLEALLRNLNAPQTPDTDPAFVYGIDQRVAVEALIARERSAGRRAMAYGLISCGSILVSGAAFVIFSAGFAAQIAAAIAAALCCWMLTFDWRLPQIALVQNAAGE